MAELEDITVLGEEWRAVAMAPGYRVSSHGRVAGLTVDILRPGHDKDGYRQVNLFVGGRGITRKVHRLVAIAFLGEPPTDRPCVNHKNGSKGDNRLENLEWCSRSENHIHAFKMGLQSPCRGERSGRAKVNSDIVREIRRRYAAGELSPGLAREFGVNKGSIMRIVHRHRWADVP